MYFCARERSETRQIQKKCPRAQDVYYGGKRFSINAKEEVSKFIHLLYDYDSPYGLPRKRALAMLHLYYCQHNR